MTSSPAHPATTGARSMVLAALSFSVMSLLVRLAGGSLASPQIVLVRSLMTLALTVALLRRADLSPWGGPHKGLLLLRGLFGAGALNCFFYSLTRLPLAEAMVIQFASPVFTAPFAALVLGEPATRRVVAAVTLGLSGVLLIARPAVLFGGAAAYDTVAVAVALTGAMLTSCVYVTVRRLARIEHELVIIFYFPLVTLPLTLAAAPWEWVRPSAWEWLLLAGVGVTAQGGQIFLTRGMKHVPAAPASVILYVQILFSGILGWLFLGERPDAWTVAGSLLILAGTLTAARRPRLP